MWEGVGRWSWSEGALTITFLHIYPEKLNLKRINLDRFTNVLRRRLGPTPTFQIANEIDRGAEFITSAIKGLLEASTSWNRPKRVPQDSLPDSILRHAQEKNLLRKSWQISRDPVDKANWICKVHVVREMVQEYRNSVWEDKIKSLFVQDRSLWRMTRNLMRVPAPRPPIVDHNRVANFDQEKADALGEHLKAQFVPTDDPSDTVHIAYLAQVIVVVSYRPLDEPEPTQVTEMSLVIVALRQNNAPGRDGIMLFSLFANDFPISPDTKLALYADNTALSVESRLNKARQRLRILDPLLSRRSALSARNGLNLYKQLLRPILNYACPARGHLADTYMRNAGVPERVSEDHCERTLDHFWKMVKSFYDRLPGATYPLIQGMGITSSTLEDAIDVPKPCSDKRDVSTVVWEALTQPPIE
ncbi:unnamed protein product [Timema podura]|uniref:Uncharacterized protein n=1 Tax=Timema podura TaxID=61482 RepID=A0ABN7NMD2_TIMPD|nr:unnamed protein product [Timema podura]